MTEENKAVKVNEISIPEVDDPILAMIQQATTISDIDTSKVQALMEMYYKDQDRKAARLFMADFASMQGELPRVVATRRNAQTQSDYAAIEDINKIVTPKLAGYGFGLLFKTKEQTDKDVTMEVTLTHGSGHTESTSIKMPLDDVGLAGKTNKTKVHGTGSAITYARRVALCSILNISIGGEDKDGNAPSDMITEEQAEKLQESIHKTSTDIQRFCRHFNITALNHMPASRYLAALGLLASKPIVEQVDANS